MIDGAAGCCTDQCESLAGDYSQFSLINSNDPKGGLVFAFAPVAPQADDPFNTCGNMIPPHNLLAIERRLSIQLNCAPGASANYLSNIVVTVRAACSCGASIPFPTLAP
jgi:hypothetical protein